MRTKILSLTAMWPENESNTRYSRPFKDINRDLSIRSMVSQLIRAGLVTERHVEPTEHERVQGMRGYTVYELEAVVPEALHGVKVMV